MKFNFKEILGIIGGAALGFGAAKLVEVVSNKKATDTCEVVDEFDAELDDEFEEEPIEVEAEVTDI